jgi:5-methylcytosine-specific restriction endonuclease McrA
MKTNILTIAIALSDRDLLARIDALAGTEREATADLVAHLAALELRPSLYLARGHGSLFDYCTRALRLSEDAASNRIQVARTCRRFPVILDRLATGSVSLSAVRMLGPHLTELNHEAVLARAANRPRGDIEALVAELAPKPDAVASVRKLPLRHGPQPDAAGTDSAAPHPALSLGALGSSGDMTRDLGDQGHVVDQLHVGAGVTSPPSVTARLAPTPRPVIQASAPNRYRVQFTIGQESHDKLRRLQALLRREIPSGDPGALFERMLDVYLEKVEKAKLGATTGSRRSKVIGRPPQETVIGRPPQETRPDRRPSGPACEIRIRPGADKHSRHIPNAVRRVVWQRDGGQCAFVSAEGRRCGERAYLELHHIQPHALKGPATAANIALRCRRHNQYESEVVFGPRH